MTSQAPPAVTPRPTLPQVLRDQRKALTVAAVMVAASLWVLSQVDGWTTAFCAAGGVLLGLANHVATELWLGRVIASGEELTRHRLAAFTFVRLMVLSVVAVGVAVLFWPSGIALLLGLAIFRLVALMMTAFPLLKELKNA